MVTGAAGFIGSRLASRLLDEGWRVVGVDALTDSYDPEEKRARARALARRSGYRHVAGDLVDLPLAEALEGVEVVYHLAGRPGVRDSFRLEERYHHDNVVATAHLVEAARSADSVRRIVYASSSSVYGDAPLPFHEDGPTGPLAPYGQTKLEAERICLEASGPSLEAVALRYFTVYGPGQRPDMGLRRFAEAALTGRAIELFGDGTQSRDFTFVDDIVGATALAATAPAAGMAINVGGGSRVSLLEVFSLLEELIGTPPRLLRRPFARGDARHTVADLRRSRDLLGFQAATSFRDGYTSEVDWLAGEVAARRTA